MSLQILSNTQAVAANGLSIPFSATGGTIPYVWSVLPNGAGGTINSSTGLYTSPIETGIDEIVVTDHLGATAELSISVCTPMELVADIIQTELGLGNGQVYLYNSKINIPIDDALYVAVGCLSNKPFANSRVYTVSSGQMYQTQSTNFQSLLSINILSRGPIARDQKEQVILALGSDYAESQMELNSFRIALLSTSFVNLSEVDGAAIPYRFNISAQLRYFVKKVTEVDSFSTFSKPSVILNS